MELVIRINNGKLEVTGPIENVVMCFGLLEAAKDAIRAASQERAERLVEPATVMPFPPAGPRG